MSEVLKINFSYNWNNKLDCLMYTTIRLRNDNKYKNGQIYEITFKDKPHSRAIIIAIKHFKLDQINEFIAGLDTGYSVEECVNIIQKMYPGMEWEYQQLSLILLKKVDQQNDKIALFCKFYEKYCGIKYKISRSEVGMIKGVEVTENLLTTYFQCDEWWAKVKSVTFYVKNYNEIRALSSGKKSQYPNYWSKSFADGLTGEKLSEYWKHLRELGLKPIKRNGVTITWK